MGKLNIYIILLILSLLSSKANSQINCDVPPQSPVLNHVTVDPISGNVTLNWKLSTSSGIAAYVLYTYNNGVGIPFDTIWDPTSTSYNHITPATKYFSVSYVVAAHQVPSCTSPLSNNLNTVFARAEIDTCTKKITLLWNSYLSYPKKVTGYTIRASVNGNQFTEIAGVKPDQMNFELEDFITDSEYCFVVITNLEGGAVSVSNKTCLSTRMQRPPEWINADHATVSSNKIALSFTIDRFSEITNFSLEKKTGPAGNFAEIAKPVSTEGKVIYIDEKADPRSVNFYRLSAINSCDIPIKVSNLASNIVLNLERVNSDIMLRWNHYMKWNGSLASYRLFADTGNGYRELAEIAASDSTFLLGYNNIMYDVAAGEICFQLSAEEISNPFGIAGTSVSQSECIKPEEFITVPDVFTPNNDLINDLFRPVLSFTPQDYTLIISDRQGKKLFETRNFSESWNGTSNGNPAPQGVYLWYLKVKTPSGKTISKTGTVTVYFNY